MYFSNINVEPASRTALLTGNFFIAKVPGNDLDLFQIFDPTKHYVA
jgi:hypothetical protein